MNQETVLMWPYLSQFVISLTNFVCLEIFNHALSGYGIKVKNSKNRSL